MKTFFLAGTIESQVKLMLDSERTFEIKITLHQTVSKYFLRQQLFAFKELLSETKLYNIFKTTNVTNFTKVVLESSYRVPQVTFKRKTLKQPVFFLEAVVFCPTFDIHIDVTLAIFWEMLQSNTYQKAHRSLSKHANIHINRATHCKMTNL